MYLVIVESPAKIKSIKSYLGKEYEVKASIGHIVDLPKSELGVDVEHGFEPQYQVTNTKALAELKKAFVNKKGLIIATDPDREGEAIGWHVAFQLGVLTPNGTVKAGQHLSRISFTSITKEAVTKAIAKPRKPDQNLFDAQQARRVLDRLVGYKLSPLLWRKIRGGLSAGRVQSVAVRLVVEREEEREAFVAEEYWKVDSLVKLLDTGEPVKIALVLSNKEKDLDAGTLNLEASSSPKGQGPNSINFQLAKIDNKKAVVTSQDQAQTIVNAIKDQPWCISNVETSQAKRYPKPPFTTSTLQQTASNWFGYSPKRTMQVAQKLYEQGLITYMRTDSTNLTRSAVEQARTVIGTQYGSAYLPAEANRYRTKAKVAQEAHEAIRPTDFGKTPVGNGYIPSLQPEHLKLYTLIWQRALSSQMTPAQIEKGRVEIELLGTKYQVPSTKEHGTRNMEPTIFLFIATGQTMLFDGYLKVYPEKFEEQVLPALAKGQPVYPIKLVASQHFTQPPARYSEATLIKALERYGIGRPSTYVPTLSTIQNRKYVEKDGRAFVPTDVGRAVTHLLKDHFNEVVDYDFTAKLESDLDNVANGDKNWVDLMREFYTPFAQHLDQKDKAIDRQTYTVLGPAPEQFHCPLCKAPMQIKLSKYGRFYSCSKYPDCKGMLGEDGKSDGDRDKDREKLLNSSEFQAVYNGAPKTDDGRDFLLKEGRFGKFWAHPDYPKVKDARPLELNAKTFKLIYGTPPKAKDGTPMVLRRGRFGEFWAHPDYPTMKEYGKVDKKTVEAKKKELGVG